MLYRLSCFLASLTQLLKEVAQALKALAFRALAAARHQSLQGAAQVAVLQQVVREHVEEFVRI